ncbi:MAG: VanZ family protein [Hydrogenophaga sp.]
MPARSSAWTLALIFAALIVYASLYPFEGWRVQGVDLLDFLWAPWPQYWTRFDLLANLLGYVPLGFLLVLGMLRSGWGGGAWPLAVLLSALLSLVVEVVQHLLPGRVPSNVDWGLNVTGALLGASVAVGLQRLGGLRRWSQFRADWFAPDAHAGLVLLALWPFALLYPASVPFGLGQVAQRLETGLLRLLAGTPFLDWVPLRQAATPPLGEWAEVLCIALGLMAPVLLGYAEVRSTVRRSVFLLALLACAMAVSGLSSALTYGPEHAWAWLTPRASAGMGMALLLGLAWMAVPARWCHVGLLLSVGLSLSLLNRAPDSAYFAQSLQVWEQGRFIRFHGLSQWLGWLWPFAALWLSAHALVRRGQRAD